MQRPLLTTLAASLVFGLFACCRAECQDSLRQDLVEHLETIFTRPPREHMRFETRYESEETVHQGEAWSDFEHNFRHRAIEIYVQGKLLANAEMIERQGRLEVVQAEHRRGKPTVSVYSRPNDNALVGANYLGDSFLYGVFSPGASIESVSWLQLIKEGELENTSRDGAMHLHELRIESKQLKGTAKIAFERQAEELKLQSIQYSFEFAVHSNGRSPEVARTSGLINNIELEGANSRIAGFRHQNELVGWERTYRTTVKESKSIDESMFERRVHFKYPIPVGTKVYVLDDPDREYVYRNRRIEKQNDESIREKSLP